ALMLRSLPVRDPQELLQVGLMGPGGQGAPGTGFSYPITRAVADQRDIFAGVGGFCHFPFDVGPPASVIRVPGALVTGGFYDTLGLNPAAGRLLNDEDD